MQSPFRWDEFLPSGVVLTTILAIATFTVSLVAQDGKVSQAATDEARSRMSASYGKLPMSFEANQGQADGAVQFLARGAGYTLFLTPGEALLSLRAPQVGVDKHGRLGAKGLTPSPSRLSATPPPSTVGLKLIGSNTKAEVAGVERLPGRSNYFSGSDPTKWHTDVPTYGKVRYSNVYPGVDLVYYGNQEGRLEHDFVVAPGADPNAIAIGLQDSDGVVAEKDGGITLHTKTGVLTLHSPTVYQTIGGERKTIPAAYLLADNQIKFQLGSYDKNEPLVIDPVLVYSGVFGGSGYDLGGSIAVDSAGNAYVTGFTQSTNFPVVNAFQGTGPSSELVKNVFVSKINAAGSALVYSTYLDCDASVGCTGSQIAVDSTGRAYVVGYTGPGFPVKNAYQSNYGGGGDAFLTVFSPAGNSLVYSTYLGGPGSDSGIAIALDSSANAYITGTSDTGFPTLHSVKSQGDIYVAKFNSAGVLQYSSILTAAVAFPQGIAVDTAGSAYITGATTSTAYPTVKPAYQYGCKACPDLNGFVTKLSPAGSQLAYSTYLGAPKQNEGNAIAVDTSGQAYVVGATGDGFPVTANAFQKSFGAGNTHGYITKLNATGNGLVYSTYLGGSGDDFITGMALDQYRQVYVTGETTSPDFPQKASIQDFNVDNSGQQGFVTTLSATGGSIVYYSTYFGTGGYTTTVAVDKALNVYLTGYTFPDWMPLTPGAIDLPRASFDVFVSKLVIMDDIALGLSASSGTVAHGGNLTYTIAVTSTGPDFGYNVRVADTLPTGTTFVSYGAGGGTCTAPAVGGTGTLNCTLPQLNQGATWSVTLTVNVNAASGTNLSNTAAAISNMQDFVPANNSGTLTTHVN